MCLANQRKSRANPNSIITGYVVMNRIDYNSNKFKSLYGMGCYLLNEWYKAEYDVGERSQYNSINTPIPGFHAFKFLNDATKYLYQDVGLVESHMCILEASFKNVLYYGTIPYFVNNYKCFRALFRCLDKCIELKKPRKYEVTY
jgi:hypothetical protein